MSPLFLLISKLLNMDEDMADLPTGDHFQTIEAYSPGLSCSPRRSYDTILPRAHSVDVPHIRQLCNWDCGLACVLMVLRTLGVDHYDIHSLAELCSTTSIWTVDLAYLLQKFSINFSFLTVTLGANPNFAFETYYKEELPSDLGRVDRLFAKAREAGIDIESRSINGKEISILILSGQYIAVALVDKYKLSRRSWLVDIFIFEWQGESSGYTGHYIIICGYDTDTSEFEIRDPSSSSKCEWVSLECLEEARKSFGTDEDILLVSLDRKGSGGKLSV